MPKSKELLSSDDDLSENEEVMKIEMIKFFPLKNTNCCFFSLANLEEAEKSDKGRDKKEEGRRYGRGGRRRRRKGGRGSKGERSENCL